MLNEIKNNILPNKQLWIIGWRLNSIKSDPDFYMIFIPDERDLPVMNNTKILLFSKKTLIEFLLINSIEYEEIDKDLELICDIRQTFDKINDQQFDSQSIILNTINFLIDSYKSLKETIPNTYANTIQEFADYLTFNKNIHLFFKNKNNKSIVKESLYYLLGFVMANSTFWYNK